MEIIYCRVPWMKYYCGEEDDDIPYYVTDISEDGSEEYCFLDYNNKCYGYVDKSNCDIEEDKEYTIVFVATNKKKEMKVVGFYKFAKVYKEPKEYKLYVNSENSFMYNIETCASDSFLLPVKERKIIIPKEFEKIINENGIVKAKDKKLETQVMDFINSYNGKYANEVYDEILFSQNYEVSANKYDEMVKYGIKAYDEEDYIEAVAFLKKALEKKEEAEILFYMADSLMNLNQFDKAIKYAKKAVLIEGEKKDTISVLLESYDYAGNIDNTLIYAEKLMNFFDKDDEVEKTFYFNCKRIMFYIYLYKKQIEKAKKILKEVKLIQGLTEESIHEIKHMEKHMN